MIYVFGDFELDTELYELREGGVRCAVEPQVFDLIRLLIEHRDRVVTREEVLDALWPDRVVSDASLSSRVKSARRALGDDGRSQAMIRTVHGRGFRFAADVEARGEAPEATGASGIAVTEPVPVGPPGDRPEIRYARSGMVNIAWQCVGSGPVDIVFVMGWVSHLEMFWVEPSFAAFLRRLSGMGRLILFDKRGTGLSDRVPPSELPTLEQRMDDVRAVMDAAGSERAVLMGVSEGAPLCTLFGATYPERTAGLVLVGGYARRLAAPDYPWGDPPDNREAFIDQTFRAWGGPVGLEARAPGKSKDAAFRDWWATYLRMGASPAAVVALMRMNDQIDVRDILPSIHVPTLVIHRRHERTLSIEHGRYLAQHIPAAEMVELDGDDHLPFVGNQEEILGPVERFIAALDSAQRPRKSLATVVVLRGDGLDRRLATIESVAELFGAALRSHDAGEIVLTLDHPARAVRLGLSAAQSHPDVSAAVHTGECILLEDSVTGPAAEMASALADLVPRGSVWITSTVHDLVAGSGLGFRDAGRRVSTPAIGAREAFVVVRGDR